MKKLILGSLILLLSTGLSAQSNPAGHTGLAFLKIGIGARAVGMGEACTAATNDATATYWNPAGLAQFKEVEVCFSHNQWFQDITHEFFAVAFSSGPGRLGLSFVSNNVGGIERRVKPSAEPLGILEAHDLALGLSFARTYKQTLSLGFTIKWLYEKIYLDSAWGIAFDVGLIYDTSLLNGLKLALVTQNLGRMNKLKEEPISLPKTIRAGLAYPLPGEILGGTLLGVADVVQVLKGNFHLNLGTEYLFKQKLAFRLGYQTGFEEKGLQGGLGMQLSRYRLDYGYVPFSSQMGNSHRFSFSVRF
ncbi:MAG: PorV/PorQ family protein [candidate division KSB1 bacterium]|nr:PorV/PorQ family protein [candidate division KSB1 bacterium]